MSPSVLWHFDVAVVAVVADATAVAAAHVSVAAVAVGFVPGLAIVGVDGCFPSGVGRFEQ